MQTVYDGLNGLGGQIPLVLAQAQRLRGLDLSHNVKLEITTGEVARLLLRLLCRRSRRVSPVLF